MNLLRENDLIFGRLLKIEEPHLIARYNKALDAFGVRQTKLASFEIDRTGFSPQIAEELGDEQYLDPNGINRRFIILTPAQIELPVVHTAFSNTSPPVSTRAVPPPPPGRSHEWARKEAAPSISSNADTRSR